MYTLKKKVLDKCDIISGDIVTKSEDMLRCYIDLKTKLHQDRILLEDKSEECTDKMMELDTNIKLLESRNK